MKKLLMFLCSGLIAGSSFAIGPKEVCVYEHANYQGQKQCYVAGANGFQVPDLGIFNDKISSIDVGSEVMVETFEHANFGGVNVWFHASTAFTSYLNDQISSLKISSSDPRTVCLFKDGNFTGERKCFKLNGQAEAFYNLTDFPGWNDQASSVDITATAFNFPGTLFVEAFEHMNGQGQKWVYDQQMTPFVGDANDRISSIRLRIK